MLSPKKKKKYQFTPQVKRLWEADIYNNGRTDTKCEVNCMK